MKIRSEEGFILLFEAVMRQAYADAEANNPKLAYEATSYIENMKKNFSN